MRRRWKWLLLALLLLPLLLCVVLGSIPAVSDPYLSDEEVVVGARDDEAEGALIFPTPVGNVENPSTPEKEALGRLLFFDPILSENNDLSCATCHHPDLGMADGRATSMGAGGLGIGGERTGGAAMARNAPSLYESAYATSLFWDGRASDLESQAETPLTLATEMHANLDDTLGELKGIEEYQSLFAAAFPDEADPISITTMTRAIAAFERTLLAHDSPFDRYAAGNLDAMTPQQRRGFALFKSGATSCYKCHSAPLFGTESEIPFAALGVPNADGALDADEGRAAITGADTDRFAFKVPTLRNVALTAPYMHNGVFATLDEVVDFYLAGGGKGMGLDVPTQSRFVHPITLSAQEREDMISFLYALTDSHVPEIPQSVPSGLPVVGRIENPALADIARWNQGGEASAAREPMTLRVEAGQTIQSVVDQARAGDTIEIGYGTYIERVVTDVDNLTIRGIPNAAGDWPILDGQMEFSDGIAASGDNFLVEQLQLKNYNGNGIIVSGAHGVTIRDIYVENTSLYGVYPVHSTDVLVERVEATAIRDAGVYAGQCRNVVIRNNVAYGNVIGIEIENSIGSELYDNHTYDNSTGIFVDLLPQLDSKVSRQTVVRNNVIENNNLANFANEGEIGALVPEGTGILVLGGDDVEITDNDIRDNRTVGVAVFSSATAFSADQLDIGPRPERVHVHGNRYANNGYDVAAELRDLGIPGADIVWDGSQWDNAFDEPSASRFPPVLPSSGWPDLAKRAYWQLLNFVVSKLL